MYRTTIISILLLTAIGLYGQSAPEQASETRELGLRFSGFDDFNLFYKKAIAEHKYRRHRFLIGRLSYNSNRADYDVNLGYAIGTEKRKSIARKLNFFHGWEYSFSIAYSNSENNSGERNKLFIINPSIGYILGFQLEVSNSFSVSAEVIPSLGGNLSIYSYDDNQYKIEANLNSNATALSLMYRF